MPKYVYEECDICGGSRNSRNNNNWADPYGKIVVSTKEIPALQKEFIITCACSSCAAQIYKAAEAKLNELRDKRESPQPPAGRE